MKINTQEAFKQHPKLKRFEVPHGAHYAESAHHFLESLLLLLEQKSIARWGTEDKSDEELSLTREMLAEHIGGINMIIRLVKEQAKQENDQTITTLNWELIDQIVQVHDIAEVLSGDKIHKNSHDEDEEDNAMQVMIEEMEKRGIHWTRETLESYWERDANGAKTSREANFVKSIDEIEGIAHMFVMRRLDKDKRGYDAHVQFFNTYTKDFPKLHEKAMYMVEKMKTLRDNPEWALDVGQYKLDFDGSEDTLKN